MKTQVKQTQIGAITDALVNGEKLSALTAFKDFGALRLGGRVFEIEKRYGIKLERKDIKGKTRFKTHFMCTEYWMRSSDAKKVKKILKETCKN